MGDVRNYDYAVLDNCINLMKTKVADIDNQCQELEAKVKGLMGTWTGSAADMYDKTAADLKAELAASGQSLETTRGVLQRGVGDMQDTDSRGAKNIQQK